MLYKMGKQAIVLRTGTYRITVKFINNNGLENIKDITLTINGEIKHKIKK
jgi:hypothetical protein